MYSYEDHVLTKAEVTYTLRRSITKALTKYPNHWTVVIWVQNDQQAILGQQLIQELIVELGDKRLPQTERVLLVANSIGNPLGQCEASENYLTSEAIAKRQAERSKQTTGSPQPL